MRFCILYVHLRQTFWQHTHDHCACTQQQQQIWHFTVAMQTGQRLHALVTKAVSRHRGLQSFAYGLVPQWGAESHIGWLSMLVSAMKTSA